MTAVNNLNNKGLSEKARENLQRNAQIRLNRKMKENRLLILNDGEEVIRIFDPEQIELREIDYECNGEKVRKFDYTVTDPNTAEIQTFRASTKTSGDIDALLAEGYRLLKLRREGSGKNTRYYITPVKES
jgi:hypothetical protein